jgi:hypothetical protein
VLAFSPKMKCEFRVVCLCLAVLFQAVRKVARCLASKRFPISAVIQCLVYFE